MFSHLARQVLFSDVWINRGRETWAIVDPGLFLAWWGDDADLQPHRRPSLCTREIASRPSIRSSSCLSSVATSIMVSQYIISRLKLRLALPGRAMLHGHLFIFVTASVSCLCQHNFTRNHNYERPVSFELICCSNKNLKVSDLKGHLSIPKDKKTSHAHPPKTTRSQHRSTTMNRELSND